MWKMSNISISQNFTKFWQQILVTSVVICFIILQEKYSQYPHAISLDFGFFGCFNVGLGMCSRSGWCALEVRMKGLQKGHCSGDALITKIFSSYKVCENEKVSLSYLESVQQLQAHEVQSIVHGDLRSSQKREEPM